MYNNNIFNNKENKIMKINTLDDMLTKKTHFNQKKRKVRISIYKKSKLKLRKENKQKNKINRLIIG
jgi:predicted component of viral defense system (DUF524 family)